MQKLATFTALIVVLACSAGCAELWSSTPFVQTASPQAAIAQPTASTQLAASSVDSCEVLGQVTANAECACYDRMSYDRLRGQASSNARELAKSKYPDSDMVQVLGVDLYLNNAVAHGIAYKCGPAS